MKIIISTLLLLSNIWLAAQTSSDQDKLKAHIQAYRKAQIEGDIKTVHRMALDLIPSRRDLNRVISPYIPDEQFDLIDKAYAHGRLVTEAEMRKYKWPKLSAEKIVITPATVQDLIEYKKGGNAFNYFPRGARGLARDGTLKPGNIFYSASIGDPAKPDTVKIELVYWNGLNPSDPDCSGWKFLGTLWNIITPKASIYPPVPNPTVQEQKSYLEGLKSRLAENQTYIQSLIARQRDISTAIDSIADERLKALESLKLTRTKLKTRRCQMFSKTLESKIKNYEAIMKFSKFSIGLENDKIAAITRNAVTNNTVKKLESELKHLRLAKTAKSKILQNSSQLGPETVDRLRREIADIEGFIAKKESEIAELKKAK